MSSLMDAFVIPALLVVTPDADMDDILSPLFGSTSHVTAR
jgi:hypothetical protein